jgi:large conductance mechanosensitive channel
MGFVKEFRNFAIKGNVIDLAIAVIIGAAFTAIVTSLVTDVITPLILQPALKAAGVEDLNKLAWGAVKYGNFLAAILNFVIIALILFMIIKGINALKEEKKDAPKEPELTLSEKTLLEIRDAMRRQP